MIDVDAGDWNKGYQSLHNMGSIVSMTTLSTRLTTPRQRKGSVTYNDNKIAAINGYVVSKQLGKGAFGEVFLGTLMDQQYAIKVLKTATMKKSSMPGQRGGGSQMDSLKSEIATMKKIAHPNCVQMLDVIYDEGQVFLVLEYVDGGTSQKSDADGNPIPLPERVMWSHLRHFVMGLEYLHMNGIVHRDIKPDNLMVTRPGLMYEGDAGMLKITDFGTSAFCDIGDQKKSKKTQGTPQFFAPEMCVADSAGSYDPRVLDLWAAGVTLYLWCCGRLPFLQPTVHLLMQDIAECAPIIDAPPEASKGLDGVIRGLLTKDPATRLTLTQLRLHDWLTDDGKKSLPVQPVIKIRVTEEEVAQAVTNRALIQEGSAAGPSALGATLSLIGQGDSSGGWKREGLATIRKRSTEQAATFWKAISASGHLAPHLPIVYSIDPVDSDGDGELDAQDDGQLVYDIRMQDLVAPMARPCALALHMGNRTVTSLELSGELAAPKPELLQALTELDATAPTAEDVAEGGVTPARYLRYLDEATSTATLGFRLDGGRTVITESDEVGPLPLPHGATYTSLKAEADIVTCLSTFFQGDPALAAASLNKVQSLLAALERSKFFKKHVFLRSRMLLAYDDANREPSLELKIMNFAWSYELPDGASVDHVTAWDGTEASHEDGFLLGVRSLERCLEQVCDALGPAPPRLTQLTSNSWGNMSSARGSPDVLRAQKP